MIKKVLMISDNDITSKESLGVTKKLLGQYKAFCNLGYDTYHLCFKDQKGVLIHGEETKVLVNKRIKLYFTYIKLLSMAHKICKENNIDLCYIRYPLADFALMRMIKKLHKLCKVVIEIPTYPYDEQNKELTGLFSKYKVFSDKYYRNKLKKYNVYFVDVSNSKRVFGLTCINIANGVDIDNTRYIGDKLKYDDTVRIIAVANVMRDHGFDRVIEGIRNYYSYKKATEPCVYFNIVGDGQECDHLERMVKDYNLSEYITFQGKKFGVELDEAFCQNNLALAGVGGHRSGLTVTSVLKVREYCARGIPFIGSLPDIAIPEDSNFYKLVDSSEEPININEIIEYYEYLKQHPEIPTEMRKFAEENLTWEKQLKKVIEKVESV